jgi:Family of unknown function (DUF5647)
VKEEYYKVVNAELGAEFDLFAVENPVWMAANVPEGAIVAIQTDDPGFNTWARAIAERNRHLDEPRRPVVLIHIRELRPAQSRIIRAEAELL